MKVPGFIALSLLLALVASGCGVPQPTEGMNSLTNRTEPTAENMVSSPPPVVDDNFSPASISFSSSQDGMMAGTVFHGTGQNQSSEGVVYATSDGGRTWELIYHGGTSIFGVTTWQHEAWFAVEKTGSQNELIHRKDGQIQMVSQQLLTNPDFLSSKLGWAIEPTTHAFETHLMMTHDGGKSWVIMNTPQNMSASMIVGEHFITPSNGWILCVGQPGAGQQGKAVYATQDGGKTWTELAHSQPNGQQGGIGGGGYAAGVDFANPTDGWIWENRGPLLHTTDSGKSWTANPISNPESFEARGISFLNQKEGYVLFDDMLNRKYVLEKTVDGGNAWAVVNTWPINN